jgi:capsular polysaccharide export protein
VPRRDVSEEAPPPRRAILLQGPVGPFFAQLQTALDAAGWETVRILFNLGDARFHGTGREISYGGRMSEWPAWFAGFLKNFGPAAVLAFGDQRAIHRDASAAARAAGVPFVCFEEGYLRPEYVTMELGGNNAASPLRRWLPAENTVPDPLAPTPMPSNGFSVTAWHAAAYFSALRVGMLRYPYYRHHRDRGIFRESLMWTRNALRKWRYTKSNLRKIHWIVEALDERYFVVALQVHDDLQLRHHGAGWTVETLIESTIASFARAAHPDHHLVFKGHPLDRGHGSSRDLTRKLARLFGVEARVHYIDDGSLGLLSRHCRGMVTVNSTSAMVAFGHAKPVFAAGESFYEILTANGADRTEEAMDRFWRFTPQLDMRVWRDFRGHMIATSQVNGSYYLPSETAATAARVVSRLDRLLDQAARERAPARPLSSRPGAAPSDEAAS